MSFLDDLRTCTYVSPSGKSFDLQFDELSRSTNQKTAVLEPPQQSRAEVQSLGFEAIRLPMAFYVSGENYHTEADALFVALTERTDSSSPGTLKHPRWGDILVALSSGPSQVEGFVDNLGFASFSVEFIRLDRMAKFPATSTDAGGQIQADSDAAAAASQDAYAANGAPTTPGETALVTRGSEDFLTATGNALRGMASAASDFGAQFEADLATALGSLDSLVSAPVELAATILGLVRKPANAALAIDAKLSAYNDLVSSMVTMTVASYAECELLFLSSGAVACAATEASLEGTLTTRSDAINAAEWLDVIAAALRSLLELAEATGWRADGDAVARQEDLLSKARARLLESSFDLKTQRSKPLPWAMDPNTAVKTLYGVWSDDLLTQFGADNDLADDEWFMIPAGRVVVWYA